MPVCEALFALPYRESHQIISPPVILHVQGPTHLLVISPISLQLLTPAQGTEQIVHERITIVMACSVLQPWVVPWEQGAFHGREGQLRESVLCFSAFEITIRFRCGWVL